MTLVIFSATNKIIHKHLATISSHFSSTRFLVESGKHMHLLLVVALLAVAIDQHNVFCFQSLLTFPTSAATYGTGGLWSCAWLFMLDEQRRKESRGKRT
jgi:hypothetical protein